MKSILRHLLLAAALTLAGAALPIASQAAFTSDQVSVESMSVTVHLEGRHKGTVTAAPCETCSPVHIKIDEHTRAYHDGKEVPLHQARVLVDKPATVIYEKATHTAVKIIW